MGPFRGTRRTDYPLLGPNGREAALDRSREAVGLTESRESQRWGLEKTQSPGKCKAWKPRGPCLQGPLPLKTGGIWLEQAQERIGLFSAS